MHSKRIVLTAMAVLAGPHLSGSAWAQDEADNTIEPQPLTKALAGFAEQTGMQLVYPSELTAGVDSKGASAEGSPDEILDELLASTGLEYEYVNDRTIAIGEATDQGGDSDSKNLTPAPILMAQNLASPTQATGRQSEEGTTSIVTGKVTDARSGANLKGAKVSIQETGQWTSTNDLGEFRFVNVPMGSATLTVSYLGYAGQSAVVGVRSDGASQDFLLRGGSEIDEIVVFGQRSARAIALNQQRTAQNNSTVISSDELGQFSSTNLPDALRRAPGVSFVQDVVTGQPRDITIRGLGRDLNSIQLNGISVPGDGITRFASVSNVLTDSIESVTVSKSLLPSQEANGTGGLIEIETKTPLDRPDRFYQFGYERAEGTSDTLTTNYFSATLSGKFLDAKSLGLSVSGQFLEEERKQKSYNAGLVFGSYLPNGISRTSEIDPRLPFPFVGGSDDILVDVFSARESQIERDNLNLTAAVAYQPIDSAMIRLDYTLIQSEVLATTSNVQFDSGIAFSERPVGALDGALRNAAAWTGFFNQSRQLNVAPVENTTHVLSLRADAEVGKWEFNSVLGFSQRETNTDGDFSASFAHDNRTPDTSLFDSRINDPIEGIILSPHDSATGIPVFSPAGITEYSDFDRIGFRNGSFNLFEGEDKRIHLEADAKFNKPVPFVNYIAVGIDIEDSELTNFSDRKSISGSTTLGAANLPAGFNAFFADESLGSFMIVSPTGAARYRDFVLENASDGGIFSVSDFLSDPLNRETYTKELNIDYYLEASLQWRDLELIAGARVTTTDVEAAIANRPAIFGPDFAPVIDAEERLRGVFVEEARQTDVLPRFLLNYRPNDSFVARAGYYRTSSRPPLGLISRFADYTLVLAPIFGDGSQKFGLFLTSNPDLQPTYTDNYDLGAEYYFNNGGVVKVNLFYKAIRDLQETLRTEDADVSELFLPDDPIFDDIIENPDEYTLTVSFPRNNGGISSVWGAEFEYEQQLTMLPGLWAGLGIFGNIAYTESEKNETASFQGEEVGISDVRFDSDPEYSGSVGATFNQGRVDASIAYTFQGRAYGAFANFGLTDYTGSYETLDLRVEYFANSRFGDWRVFVEGSDLLRGDDEAIRSVEYGGEDGVPAIKEPGGRFGGRAIRIGFATTF